MVDEPDNVVLRMLREIRAKQDEHSATLNTLHKDVEEVKFQVTYGLGVACIDLIDLKRETVAEKSDEVIFKKDAQFPLEE